MKLLIIAGPYEADRIRKTAVAVGLETVAVEPGESLSGWITASRPDVIVMAPQIVHPDPATALAKVRSVPRGRVPVFLVGDDADAPRMLRLSDGFLSRPVSPEALLAATRKALPAAGRPGGQRRSRTAEGLGPSPSDDGAPDQAPTSRRTKTGSHGRAPGATLRPLVIAADDGAPLARAAALNLDASTLLAELDAGIDAVLEAELRAALAGNGLAGGAAPPPAADPAGAPAADGEFRGEATKDVRDDLHAESSRALSAEVVRARVLARHAVVEEGDYFQVLGVRRDATAADLQRAYDHIAGELGSQAAETGVAAELAAELDAIRVVAAEALRILCNDRLRARYAGTLSEGR